MKDLISALRISAISLVVFTLLLGLGYPLVVGVLGAVLPHPAPSQLVGQPFDEPGYFWSRPTAVTAYNAMTSSGTNVGPSSPALVDAVKGRIATLRAADPGNTAPVPVDLVTASASGLDPDISPAAAYYQVGRVATARGVAADTVRSVVDRSITERQLGILGERRVNVVALNQELDRELGAPRP